MEATSIQILQMVALIAGRGRIPPMHPAVGVLPKRSVVEVHFGEHTWNVLQEGMKIAVRSGTAKNLDQDDKLHLAVKTGTTEHGRKFQSWLAGYFPYDSPRYAFCLRANVGTSYEQAVPLARNILFNRTWP
jgi:cell division protein FtsI/penicillin-binding protein 2